MGIYCNKCDNRIEISDFYTGEENGIEILGVDGYECAKCGAVYNIKFRLMSIEQVGNIEEQDEDQDMEYDIGSKVSITNHYESLEDLYAFINTLEKTEISEDDKEDIIPVVTVTSNDDDYPYAVELYVCLDDYKETFRTQIYLLENGEALNVLGTAGEYEFDPLKTIEDCVNACLEIAEEWFE